MQLKTNGVWYGETVTRHGGVQIKMIYSHIVPDWMDLGFFVIGWKIELKPEYFCDILVVSW